MSLVVNARFVPPVIRQPVLKIIYVVMQTFGTPVEPEVKTMYAKSEGETLGKGGTLGADSSSSGKGTLHTFR